MRPGASPRSLKLAATQSDVALLRIAGAAAAPHPPVDKAFRDERLHRPIDKNIVVAVAGCPAPIALYVLLLLAQRIFRPPYLFKRLFFQVAQDPGIPFRAQRNIAIGIHHYAAKNRGAGDKEISIQPSVVA